MQGSIKFRIKLGNEKAVEPI